MTVDFSTVMPVLIKQAFFLSVLFQGISYNSKGGHVPTLRTGTKKECDRTPQNLMTKDPKRIWPKAIVPVVFDEELATGRAERKILDTAIEMVEINTCVRFVPLSEYTGIESKAYLHFTFEQSRNTCYIGRNVEKQEITIQRGTESTKSALQKLFHALGRYDEHTRRDRDKYVKVFPDNIEPDKQYMFNREFVGTTQMLPYDYQSITHIPMLAYSKNNNPTIMALSSTDQELGTSDLPTLLDYLHINLLYCNATEIMIKDFELKLRPSILWLKWIKPEYPPNHYVLQYSLIQESTGQVYVQAERVIDQQSDFYVVEDVWLGSVCKVNLKAVYNPSSLDKGITRFIGPAISEEIQPGIVSISQAGHPPIPKFTATGHTTNVPSGAMAVPSGAMGVPSGAMAVPSGAMAVPSGVMVVPSGAMAVPSGAMAVPSGAMALPPEFEKILKMHTTHFAQGFPSWKDLTNIHVSRFQPHSEPVEQAHLVSLQADPMIPAKPQLESLMPAKPQSLQMLSLPQGLGKHDSKSRSSVPKQREMPPFQFDLRARSKAKTLLLLKWNELPEKPSKESKETYSLTISLRTAEGEVINEQVRHLSENRHIIHRPAPNTQYMVTVKAINHPQILPETIVYPQPQLKQPESVKIVSTESFGGTVKINWKPCFNEYDSPNNILLKYSYNGKNYTTIPQHMYTTWTIYGVEVPSTVSFQLQAINSGGTKGPITYATHTTSDKVDSVTEVYGKPTDTSPRDTDRVHEESMMLEPPWLVESVQPRDEQAGSLVSLPMLNFPDEMNENIDYRDFFSDYDVTGSSEEQAREFGNKESNQAIMDQFLKVVEAEQKAKMILKKAQLDRGGTSQVEMTQRATLQGHEPETELQALEKQWEDKYRQHMLPKGIADFPHEHEQGAITDDKLDDIASKMQKEYEALQSFDMSKEEKKSLQESTDADIAARMQGLYFQEYYQQPSPDLEDLMYVDDELEGLPGHPHSDWSSEMKSQSEELQDAASSEQNSKILQERKDAEMAAKLQAMFQAEFEQKTKAIQLKEMLQDDQNQIAQLPISDLSIFKSQAEATNEVPWPDFSEHFLVPGSNEAGVVMLENDIGSDDQFGSEDYVVYYPSGESDYEEDFGVADV